MSETSVSERPGGITVSMPLKDEYFEIGDFGDINADIDLFAPCSMVWSGRGVAKRWLNVPITGET